MQYYCEMCEEDHAGRPVETRPILWVGCCFEMEWEGTREQAGELYDYLVGQGVLTPRLKCENGNVDYDDDQVGEPYLAWICGECGTSYTEDEENPQQMAVECCREKLLAQRAELMEEEGV